VIRKSIHNFAHPFITRLFTPMSRTCHVAYTIILSLSALYVAIIMFRSDANFPLHNKVTGLISSTIFWLMTFPAAFHAGHMHRGDVWVCARCDYEIGDEKPPAAGEPIVCPECGTDLRPADATVQGHIMSSKGRTRLYSFVFALWALSTTYWLYMIP